MKLSQQSLSGLAAVVLAGAMFITGSLAMEDYSEHKTNFLVETYSEDSQVFLLGNSDEINHWSLNQPISQSVAVQNDSDRKAYVRLQFKEFMGTGSREYTYTSKRYMIDSDGNFIRFETQEAAQTYIDENKLNRSPYELTGYYDDQVYWYIPSQADDPNGQYGRFVETGIRYTEMVSLLDDSSVSVSNNQVDESAFVTHSWDSNSAFKDYIEWSLGANVIKKSAWDGVPVSKWIYDDSGASTWVYWGQLLSGYDEDNPNDNKTEIFLDSVKLIQVPDKDATYRMHINLDVAYCDEEGSCEDIFMWEEASEAFLISVGYDLDHLNAMLDEYIREGIELLSSDVAMADADVSELGSALASAGVSSMGALEHRTPSTSFTECIEQMQRIVGVLDKYK